MAVSSAVSNHIVRDVSWSKQSSHHVEDLSNHKRREVLARDASNQPRALVDLPPPPPRRLHHLPPQNHPLLRGRPPRVPASHPSQLLLCSSHINPLLGTWNPTLHHLTSSLYTLVLPYGSNLVS